MARYEPVRHCDQNFDVTVSLQTVVQRGAVQVHGQQPIVGMFERPPTPDPTPFAPPTMWQKDPAPERVAEAA